MLDILARTAFEEVVFEQDVNDVKGQPYKSVGKHIPARRSSVCKDLRQERTWCTGRTTRKHNGWGTRSQMEENELKLEAQAGQGTEVLWL